MYSENALIMLTKVHIVKASSLYICLYQWDFFLFIIIIIIIWYSENNKSE